MISKHILSIKFSSSTLRVKICHFSRTIKTHPPKKKNAVCQTKFNNFFVSWTAIIDHMRERERERFFNKKEKKREPYLLFKPF